MTNEQAIEILMDIQSDWEVGEEYEAIDLAIQALEKQIPKYPRWKGPTNMEKDNAEAYCPACEYYLDEDYLVCPDCFQWLDWSDNNDL